MNENPFHRADMCPHGTLPDEEPECERCEIARLRAAIERKDAALEKCESAHTRTIDERDNAEEWADKLSDAIATHLGIEIGEHSSENLPWANALTAIDSALGNVREEKS